MLEVCVGRKCIAALSCACSAGGLPCLEPTKALFNPGVYIYLMCIFIYKRIRVCIHLYLHTYAYFQPAVVTQRSASLFVIFRKVYGVNYQCYLVVPVSPVTVVKSLKCLCASLIDFQGSVYD